MYIHLLPMAGLHYLSCRCHLFGQRKRITFSYTTNVGAHAGVTLKKKKQQQQWHKQYTLKSTINVFSPRTFSLIRYGYCYYRGELPIRWHFMTRDFLKLSFEAYWWNESNFVVRQEVITVYQINTPDISINVKEKKNKETLTHR